MTITTTPSKTSGISPKAVLAFLFPAVATAAGVLADWIVTGDLDVATLRAAAAGVVLSAVAALGAYLGRPGTVTDDPR